MPTFRGLTEDRAKLEFALTVLHTMPEGNIATLDALFDEAKQGSLFDTTVIENLRTDAKKILPVKFMYETHEEEKMKEFQDYRDKILALCK